MINPGDKLPPERALAESFGVKRGHIREALKKLEFYGILDTYPQDGTYVAGLGVKAIEGLIKNVLSLNSTDVKSLLETRSILEIEAVKLTCQRASEDEIAQIEEAHLEFKKRIENQEIGLDEDLLFHTKIAQFCQNPVLYSIITLLTPEMLKLSHAQRSCKYDRYLTALQEHKNIISALKSRDHQKCVKHMQEHMRNTALSFK